MIARRSLLQFLGLLAAFPIIFSCVPPAMAEAPQVTTKPLVVFAAASLKNALDTAIADYFKKTGTKVTASYAASSALAKQIEQGAPADIFISADLDWMDYLSGKQLIRTETRSNLLDNSLVLIAPNDSTSTLKIDKGFKLAEAIGDGRIAVADVKSVPAGKYATAALEKLGAYDEVAPKFAQAENVRAALALVATGEAPFGIVYRTDANAEPRVKVIDTFPEDTHPPIVYPIAVTASAGDAGSATAFVNFLGSDAQDDFAKAGFTIAK